MPGTAADVLGPARNLNGHQHRQLPGPGCLDPDHPARLHVPPHPRVRVFVRPTHQAGHRPPQRHHQPPASCDRAGALSHLYGHRGARGSEEETRADPPKPQDQPGLALLPLRRFRDCGHVHTRGADGVLLQRGPRADEVPVDLLLVAVHLDRVLPQLGLRGGDQLGDPALGLGLEGVARGQRHEHETTWISVANLVNNVFWANWYEYRNDDGAGDEEILPTQGRGPAHRSPRVCALCQGLEGSSPW